MGALPRKPFQDGLNSTPDKGEVRCSSHRWPTISSGSVLERAVLINDSNAKEALQAFSGNSLDGVKEHNAYIHSWVRALRSGIFDGMVYSENTIKFYQAHIEEFFQSFGVINVDNVEDFLAGVPATSYAKREKCYKSIICFAKFLIRKRALHEDFIQKIKYLKPKRKIEPKRSSLTKKELDLMLEYAHRPMDKMILLLLANTGLRASEAINIDFEDINFEARCLFVNPSKVKTKNGKGRRIGLTPVLYEYLQAYIERTGIHEGPILMTRYGRRYERKTLCARVRKLAAQVGLQASPHSLRRAFVTINANAGKPLQMLQMACGHSSILITREYCRTTEQEMVEAMQAW